MKIVLLLCSAMGLEVIAEYQYVTADDYVDIDAVIADLPSLQSFINCFLDRGPCNTETESYKRILQDSIIRACDRCNLPQKQRYAKFLTGLRVRLPHDYVALRQKYDPYGIYFDALEAELVKYISYDSTPPLFPFYYLIK